MYKTLSLILFSSLFNFFPYLITQKQLNIYAKWIAPFTFVLSIKFFIYRTRYLNLVGRVLQCFCW